MKPLVKLLTGVLVRGALLSIIVRDMSPEPVCTVLVSFKIQ